MLKTALITGVTGQDGSYLADLLLGKGYLVHGIKRRSSSLNSQRIDHIFTDPHEPNGRFHLHFGDMTDSTNLIRILQAVRPDEIYNLAAQSHVQVSFETPEYTANADAIGTLRLLEAIRILDLQKTTRFYPRSPYGVAKLYGYWITVNYREAYCIHASNGILFNHESPRRGETFVTRKITRAVAAIHHGRQDRLRLGNLNAIRDWGHARDFVEGMWRILQYDRGDDFVLATGEAHSVREFVERAFSHVGVEIAWRGKDIDEVGLDAKTGRTLIEVDPRYFRPTEVELLVGDATKAERLLGWTPTCRFDELVREMVEADVKAEAARAHQGV